MKIKEYKSYDEMSKWVVEQIIYAINFNFMSSYFTLGLATGSTPLGIYKYMRDETWDSKKIYTFNLDEYADLPYNHPQSYEFETIELTSNGVNWDASNYPSGIYFYVQTNLKTIIIS